MAEFRTPMLCKTTEREYLDRSSWQDYVAEPKHDGARCIAVRGDDAVVKLFTRTGHEFTEHVPHVVAALEGWLPPSSIIDGELAIIDGEVHLGRRRVPITNFNATMRILGSLPERGRALQDDEFGPIRFIVYDLLEWDGNDSSERSQEWRRKELKSVFPFGSVDMFLNPVFDDPSRFGALFDTLIGHGIEGIIVKNKTAPYVFDGRPNKTWYKVKAAVTMDMIVSGYTEGAGKYEGLIGAVEFSRMGADGKLVRVGRCSGMTDELRREISADKDKYLGRVIEVKSNELVGSKEYRSPRHPQFVAFRFDKHPQDCTGEELRAVNQSAA